MALKVNEIFYSIQGESTYAGRPCVFVRLTGCNLRCSYCDTQYAYEEGDEMEIDRIVHRVGCYNCPLVEVTGGEPLIQKETPGLVHSLIQEGYKVLTETNGSQDISRLDDRCVRIVDVKCPASGEHHHNDLANLDRLTDGDEIKFVISNREDYEFARDMVDSKVLGKNPVHFSPVFGMVESNKLAGWLLDDHLNVRLHLQLHKIIWEREHRGV
ncbi:MAG: radical SAM protein [Thermodesulfobacteriota bacterium]|nr:radical SAM protein [Thermodesulfobacteriota bacterium]